MKSLKLIFVVFLISLFGCSTHFRSPIVFKKTPEKEKTAPRPEKIVPPPPLKPAEKPRETADAQQEPWSTEEPITPEEISEETPRSDIESETVEATVPRDRSAVSSAKNIAILAPEYVKNSEYNVLGKIIVKDVSQTGFNKQEAREAIQVEAFRRFGSHAKAIINVTYGDKAGVASDSQRISEVSGDVITWEGEKPGQKPVIEKDTKPAPAEEPQPSSSSPETKTESQNAPSDAAAAGKTKTESPGLNPQAKPEPPAPDAPSVDEQQLEQ